MSKNRDFNLSFDVKNVSVPQILLKLQAKTLKNDISIFRDFVKKTRQNVACQFQSKWHRQTLRLKNLLLNFTNCILKKTMLTPIINGNL